MFPPNSLTTHTAPPAAAMALGPSPTGIVATTASRAGSTRVTVPSRLFATHSDPALAATPVGPPPTAIVSLDDARSRVYPRERARFRARHPQRPRAEREPGRIAGQVDPPAHASGARVEPRHRVDAAARHPHRAIPDSDLARSSSDAHDLHDAVRGGVDPRHRPVEAVRDPDRSGAGGDPAWAAPDPDRLLDRPGMRIHPRERPVVELRDPERAQPGRHARGSHGQRDGCAELAVAGGDRADGVVVSAGERGAGVADRKRYGDDGRDRDRAGHDDQAGRPAPGAAHLGRHRSPLHRRRGPARRHRDSPGVSRGRVEHGLLAQDCLLDRPQARPRFEAQLFDEVAPRLPVRLQRLRLAAGPVEREHQLAAQPLAERVLGDESLELRDERRASAEPSSASIRSSSAASRSSSRRSTSTCANGS